MTTQPISPERPLMKFFRENWSKLDAIVIARGNWDKVFLLVSLLASFLRWIAAVILLHDAAVPIFSFGIKLPFLPFAPLSTWFTLPLGVLAVSSMYICYKRSNDGIRKTPIASAIWVTGFWFFVMVLVGLFWQEVH
ncbi:MAG TPA: hypothetical protein VLI92_04025 [Candidatus Saccharimonadales bacterium]|nr:hypothetical protein [Candidatus Saccharimonadales bacterium]